MRKKELKKRVLGKLVEFFTGLVWEINAMDKSELEQMDKDLLHALHEGQTGIGLGNNRASN